MKLKFLLIVSFFIIGALKTSIVFSIEFSQQVAEKSKIIKSTGVSECGLTRYEALNSARQIAQRNLLESVKGVFISNLTVIKDGITIYDNIISRAKGVLKNAHSCGEKYYEETGYAEVCMQIGLKDDIETLFMDTK